MMAEPRWFADVRRVRPDLKRTLARMRGGRCRHMSGVRFLLVMILVILVFPYMG